MQLDCKLLHIVIPCLHTCCAYCQDTSNCNLDITESFLLRCLEVQRLAFVDVEHFSITIVIHVATLFIRQYTPLHGICL